MKAILKGAVVLAGIVLVSAFGGTVVAAASPKSTVTVQDGANSGDGAGVDTDGTQGDYKPAMDGTSTSPIMVAAPQFKAAQG
jgi:hypothetical protein